MNLLGKKFISLFLVFSLLTINCASLRTTSDIERRGVLLEITKKDGKTISGELFAVKKNSLLLFPGAVVSIDIADIEKIVIVKNSKVKQGIIIWGLVGAVTGGFTSFKNEDWNQLLNTPLFVLIGGAVGILIGATIGAVAGIDKKIQIEGMSDSEIQRTLDKLRKNARVRDYK